MVISFLLGGSACGRFPRVSDNIINGPLPTSTELFASSETLKVLSFHARWETDRAKVFEVWSDTRFLLNSTAVVFYKYIRDTRFTGPLRLVATCCKLRWPIPPHGWELADAFLLPFTTRAAGLVQHVRQAMLNLGPPSGLAIYKAFQLGELVGEVQLAYSREQQDYVATIGFFEKLFYERDIQPPGQPAPEQLVAG